MLANALSFEQILSEPNAGRVLIYGIGNLGRQDDGLGIQLIEQLEKADLPKDVTLEANYQLNVEDALLMTEFDCVIFADASKKSKAHDPYELEKVEPSEGLSHTSHAMAFSSVLKLCQDIYGKSPRTFQLAIPGYEWEVNESMSPKASKNLEETLGALLKGLQCMKSRS